jgi:hypothetical protein
MPLRKLLHLYRLPGYFIQRMESCLIDQRRSILGFKVMRSLNRLLIRPRKNRLTSRLKRWRKS